jgi:hypothetical protein
MMENDVEKRISLALVLADPFIRDAGDSLSTEAGVQGIIAVKMYSRGAGGQRHHADADDQQHH